MIGIVIIAVIFLQNRYGSDMIENTAPEPQISATSTVVERDVVEAAKIELERINAELDAEETRLLEEKAKLEAQYKTETDSIEMQLSEIRETRTSF